MKIARSYKALLRPLSIGAGCLVTASLLYIGVYVFVEYKQYLRTYQETQQGELTDLQQKVQAQTGKLKQILKLTGSRISLVGGESKRIQNILTSAFRLYDPHEIPKIQNFSYYKFSPPQMLITRLNASPLQNKPLVPGKIVSAQPIITFHPDSLEGKNFLVGEEGNLEGFLKLDVLLSDLKSLLGNPTTLFLTEPSFSKYLVSPDSSLIVRPPPSLWEFAHLSKNRYGIFVVYTLLLLPIVLGTAVYLYQQIKSRVKQTMDTFRDQLESSRTAEESSFNRAILSEKKHKVQQISSHAHRKFQAALSDRFQEHAFQTYNNLTVLKQSMSRTNLAFSLESHMNLINAGLHSLKFLSQGLVPKTKHEPIKLKALLEESCLVFTDKLYKANITLERLCSEELIFYGDALFSQVIFMNIIGKAIHRVTKNGTLTIQAIARDQTLCITLQDQGFPPNQEVESHMKRSFDFVITDHILKKMCSEAGINYVYSRSQEGVNFDELLIPMRPEENLESNVIPLFS